MTDWINVVDLTVTRFFVFAVRVLEHTLSCKRLLGLKSSTPIRAVAFEQPISASTFTPPALRATQRVPRVSAISTRDPALPLRDCCA